MSPIVLTLTFTASVVWCAERLVRSRNPAACLLALPTLLGSWVVLMTLRTPPTAEFALAAFTLADGAVLVLSVLGVLRLLGGFEPDPNLPDDDENDDKTPPIRPLPRSPRHRRIGPRPTSRMPARRPIRDPTGLARAWYRGDRGRRIG